MTDDSVIEFPVKAVRDRNAFIGGVTTVILEELEIDAEWLTETVAAVYDRHLTGSAAGEVESSLTLPDDLDLSDCQVQGIDLALREAANNIGLEFSAHFNAILCTLVLEIVVLRHDSHLRDLHEGI